MIYCDWAATTPICEAAKEIIMETLDLYGNPSSNHWAGVTARNLIENARAKIARCINAEPDEIFFTSGGSEANTWMTSFDRVGFSLISPLEHHSMLGLAYNELVDSDGIVNLAVMREILDDDVDTCGTEFDDYLLQLRKYESVSCMYVNNELGTIQPIKKIVEIAHKTGRLFGTDAVQALGHIKVDVKDIGCDFLSASGHKFGAPKGIGFLYIKKDAQDEAYKMIQGGKQEMGMRGGTENTLGIVAMAEALEYSVIMMDEHNQYVRRLRDYLLEQLMNIEGAHLNGSLFNRVDSNINIRFDGISGADLVSLCDVHGICISSGSACNEGVPKPSHVLKAIGLSDEEALSSVRITLGYKNTMEEMKQVADVIRYSVQRLREARNNETN